MATIVESCPCVGVQDFYVKSAGTKMELRQKATVPYHTRNNGADYQNQKFGNGMRLHNIGVKGSTKTHTCTVCGKRKSV